MRALLLIHRYLGIAAGLLMVSWCASGFVMMYVSYPRLTESERASKLEAIVLSACPGSPRALPPEASAPFRIEMLSGRPVLSQAGAAGVAARDLCTGEPLAPVTLAAASRVARAYLGRATLFTGLIDQDQWTVAGQARSERPFYRFATSNGDGSEVYVSRGSGHLVQATTRAQRFWNWLGAIPHWLYVFELRRHPQQWTRLVIATSLVGCFLSVTGLYLGFRRLPRFSKRAVLGARGAHFWHHVSGVFLGLFTLTWVGSGLLSMQPWGLFESSKFDARQLQGPPPSPEEVQTALRQLSLALAKSSFVTVESQRYAGTTFFVARTRNGKLQRLDVEGHPATPSARDWSELARKLGSAPPQLLTAEDSYLLSQQGESAVLPAYRFALPDRARHDLYFDAATGLLTAQLDHDGRVLRWIEGVHRVDLLPGLRRRPTWDLLVLALLSGVSLVCLSGAWLAYRSLFVRKR